MAAFTGWGTAWGDSWGAVSADPNAMAGSAAFAFSANGSLTSTAQQGAGVGSRLADHEADWARRKVLEAVEAAQAEPAKVRRKVRREAAQTVYFSNALQDVAQVYVDRLKAEKEAAQLAEMRALLDLQEQAGAAMVEVARAAVQMARSKQKQAAQALEEFDVMYVAALMAAS